MAPARQALILPGRSTSPFFAFASNASSAASAFGPPILPNATTISIVSRPYSPGSIAARRGTAAASPRAAQAVAVTRGARRLRAATARRAERQSPSRADGHAARRAGDGRDGQARTPAHDRQDVALLRRRVEPPVLLRRPADPLS